jgi:hypothetical protein
MAKTIEEFCDEYRISKPTFYLHGPAFIKIGRRTLIEPAQEAEWIAARLAEARRPKTEADIRRVGRPRKIAVGT